MGRSAVPAGLRSMKRNDIILIAALAVIALAAFGGVTLYAKFSTREPEAVVLEHGEEKGRYPLSHDITLEIRQDNGAYNILQIEDGKADMIEASCPDKVCVRHRPVNGQGESLVCLPNRVAVEIQNAGGTEVDASTR